jgi:hypothetical protein
MSGESNNISFLLHEESNTNFEEEINFDMKDFLEQIEKDELLKDELQHDLMLPSIIHYHENFTMKELLVICDYYGLKTNKCKKDTIVHILTNFETNYENQDIVSKRKNLWFYINELKNDKFMKKYLLW